MKIESTANISIETLNDIIAESRIFDITIQDPENYPVSKSYDVFAMLTIKRAINEFLKGCPERNPSDPNTEKQIFAYIYTKLAYFAEYDDLARDVARTDPMAKGSLEIDYLNSSSGLEGVFIRRKALCSGFAEALRNLLAENKIESKYITGWTNNYKGTGKKVGHAWNQVKLDGEWFNCDITCDREFILQGLIAPKFLKSGADFSNYYKYPEGSLDRIEKTPRSISNEAQSVLIHNYKSRIIDELYPKEKENKSKKKGFIRTIFSKLKANKSSQRGDE